LTLIAFEEMFVWGPDGHRGRHTFYKNNEMAGYCAVLDALRLKGTDGHYGKQRKVVILSFGAVSRGAIYALKARGFRDITICVQRAAHLVREEVLGCHYVRMRDGEEAGAHMFAVEHDGAERLLLDLISEADIVVNGTFQDPDQPLMFVTEEEISQLKPGCLIIDVSCDEGMGFPFARPTTFENPTFKVGPVDYYAVDHTPSYLWESASWEISLALLRFLPVIMDGPERWERDETIRRAIEIQDGAVRNPGILSFQRRSSEYPHEVLLEGEPRGQRNTPGPGKTRISGRGTRKRPPASR
jgi:NAD/NADP transhydrogenase alpha subunit